MNKNGVEIKGLLEPSIAKKLNSAGTIIYSEIDYIFISKRNYPIIDLKSILIDLEILNERKIELNDSSIVSLDGVKKFAIEYMDNQNKKIMLNKSVPFNSFFEIPKNLINYTGFKINILDAFFHNIDDFTIYSYLNYLITIDGLPVDTSYNPSEFKNLDTEDELNTNLQFSTEKEKELKVNTNLDLDIVNYYYDMAPISNSKKDLIINDLSIGDATCSDETISKTSSNHSIDNKNISSKTSEFVAINKNTLNQNNLIKNVDLDEEFM
ncbi:hypothetical protein SAMN02745163_04205 [Clostridium cavendishii DSM 21758]|uniref:Uncharacterized protein n=1 Tax=Clostridium cavendishii DSM 21758 TaxID=1121302 RepID=A0A1M6U7Y5_9CLOT|nr:hypothetical protein [Clostridium cavendishii]SHK65266.1 hypothetical protein SAMN02745163_04205 [Clostridium cavendishii DSM 21758]